MNTSSSRPSLPGPSGLPYLGVALSLRSSALDYFRTMQHRYGDIVSLPVLGSSALLLSNPADIERVLIDDAPSYGRSAEMRNLRPIFGNGLLSSEGELWRSQRRRIQPSFQHQKIIGYTTTMLDAIRERTALWSSGQTIEAHEEMMGFTRDVVCNSLFGQQPTTQMASISDAVTTIFSSLRSEILYLPLWQRLPTRRSVRWRRAVQTLYKAIAEIIAERRANPQADRNDMLGALLSAQDEDGTTMSDLQIRDEVMTMFLAGHETSAISLTWALHLLSTHPQIQDEAAAEVLHITAGQPLTSAHHPRLKQLIAILHETLRLYPPVWSIGREATKETTLNSHAVKKGTRIWMCTYNVHHDARWYHNPESFLPNRWTESSNPQQPRPKLSFFPFGAGARMCIGQNFALIEAVLALAEILRNFRIHPAGSSTIETEAWVTLRPKSGLPIRLERR